MLVLGTGANAKTGTFVNYMLLADKDQYAGRQRQDCHHDAWESKVKKCRESNKNQIDGKKEHSEVFGNVHGTFLRQCLRVCTLLNGGLLNITLLSMGQESRRSFHVETSCPLEQWWPVRRVISHDRSPRNSKGKGAHGLSLSLTR